MKQIKIVPVLVGICAVMLAILVVYSVVSSGGTDYNPDDYVTLCKYKELSVQLNSDGTAKVLTSADGATAEEASFSETSSAQSQPQDFEDILNDYYEGVSSAPVTSQASSDSAANTVAGSLDDALWNYVLDNTTVKNYPSKQLNDLKKSFTDEATQNASKAGVSLSSYALTTYGMDDAQFSEYVDEMSKTILKQRMILKSISKAEKLELSADEIEAGTESYINEYSTSSKTYTAEQIYSVFDGKDGFEEQLLLEKVIGFIKNSAVVSADDSCESDCYN